MAAMEPQKARISETRKVFSAELFKKTGTPISGPSSLYPPGTVKAAAKVTVATSVVTIDSTWATDLVCEMLRSPGVSEVIAGGGS